MPAFSLLAVAATAWWIRKSKRFDLVYLWSLVAGGTLLSRSRGVSGIFFHEYHYDWLWTPIRMALVLIVAVSIVSDEVSIASGGSLDRLGSSDALLCRRRLPGRDLRDSHMVRRGIK